MISSMANKQVRFVNGLVKKARKRREEGLFVAEGSRLFAEIPRQQIHSVYVSQSFLALPANQKLLEGLSSVEEVTDGVFRSMSDTQTPQGILAIVRMCRYTLLEVIDNRKKPVHLFVLEGLQDPGNLGTIIRSGEGAGVTGIIMDAGTADIYNPKVIRSTMGSIFRVPFFIAENLEMTLTAVRQSGIRLYAAHLQGKENYDREDYTGNIGFLIGSEAKGLSGAVSQMADVQIMIPMEGQAESLNAAAAASVLMFEAARQRRQLSAFSHSEFRKK